MDKIRSQLNELSLWQLVQLIISVALEIQARLNNGPWGQRQNDTPMEPAAPPSSSSGINKGKGKGVRSFTEDYDSNVVCDGECIACGNNCIRLQPFHKHCKCKRHLHYR